MCMCGLCGYVYVSVCVCVYVSTHVGQALDVDGLDEVLKELKPAGVCMRVCVCVCVYVCMCICVYVYIGTQT